MPYEQQTDNNNQLGDSLQGHLALEKFPAEASAMFNARIPAECNVTDEIDLYESV